jgi:hypothetical protein
VTTTITAYQLAELLRKVDPHIGRTMGYAAIQGVRLDHDGRNLHAVATDRYTLAVARQKTAPTTPWAASINGSDRDNQLAAVTTWLATHDGEDAITLTADLGPTGNALTLASRRSNLTVPVYAGHFPDWRGLIRTAVDRDGTDSPWTGQTSKLLARWEAAGREICTWQSAFDKPMVVTANSFIGIQMPRRIADEESPAGRHDEWADSLGTGAPVEMDDTLTTYEPQELEERDNAIDREIESLLKLALRSTSGAFNAATGDTGALTAYILAGTQSWTAYRLLKALQKADPNLLHTVLAETSEELESGEIGEWARDEAERAGHNPQQWADDYDAHLKQLAADKGAAA